MSLSLSIYLPPTYLSIDLSISISLVLWAVSRTPAFFSCDDLQLWPLCIKGVHRPHWNGIGVPAATKARHSFGPCKSGVTYRVTGSFGRLNYDPAGLVQSPKPLKPEIPKKLAFFLFVHHFFVFWGMGDSVFFRVLGDFRVSEALGLCAGPAGS